MSRRFLQKLARIPPWLVFVAFFLLSGVVIQRLIAGTSFYYSLPSPQTNPVGFALTVFVFVVACWVLKIAVEHAIDRLDAAKRESDKAS